LAIASNSARLAEMEVAMSVLLFLCFENFFLGT
jgi:hypothetical protein